MKTNKSYSKRFKVTKNGKIVGRRMGQNHFNAKGSGNAVRRKRGSNVITMTNTDRGRYLNNA
ncbi:MAG TPA: 50S ribosomal protein L35 [Candidatus Paceibacterota bacterium]